MGLREPLRQSVKIGLQESGVTYGYHGRNRRQSATVNQHSYVNFDHDYAYAVIVPISRVYRIS